MIWSVFDPRTGLFTGQVLSGSRDIVDLNVPAGLAVLPGRHDHLTSAVENGRAVPRSHTSTAMELAESARARRNAMLAASDWVSTRAMERGEPTPAAWATYRQALRDVPQQPGFPGAVVWPVAPQ